MPVNPVRVAYVCATAFLQVALLAGCNQASIGNRTEAARNANDPIAAPAVIGPERLILAFGDSLYAGYGLKRGENMPAHVETRLRGQGIHAKVINAGVSGDTTSAGRKRLSFALDKLARKPDLVMLGLGGNDVLRQIPVAETRANMVAMLEDLQQRQIPVVLTGMRAPPNLGPDYVSKFDALYADLARRYHAELDPFVLEGVLGKRRLMLTDGIHPNAMGIEVMAARIAPIVARQLQREASPDDGR
jgi:acyl-CoA thioesterase-1